MIIWSVALVQDWSMVWKNWPGCSILNCLNTSNLRKFLSRMKHPYLLNTGLLSVALILSVAVGA
ncbi:MAG: hypothetical protein GWN30_05360, partial [Gammaproteobacteria bacterium]|nr:hypothetical protein [Gammaproteobacteria bacterium]